jgi:predicted ABC-type ATPase
LRASNYDRLQRYVNRTVKRAANVVTFEQALKGYPEYRADQPRGEGGRWSGGGGATPATDDRAGALLRRNMERDPGFTADEFIKQLPKDQQDFIARSERKLARGTPTEAPVSKGGFRTEDGKHWIPSRQRVHEKIIRDMIGEAVERGAYPKDGEAPTIILMGGRGGAGKTTVVKTQLGIDPENDDRFLYLNSDDIKAKLPGFAGWNAGLLHEESSHVSDQIERIARELGLNIIYDATLKSEGSAVQRINESEAAGYNIEGVFVHTTPYTSATRAMARAVKSGRYVPPSYILGSTSNERTFDAVKGRMHKWVLFDNKGSFSPKKIASGGKRRRK